MKEYFYTITEGMIDLGLRGTELNLFAIIFGYSQKGDGCCYATRRELARRCGVSSTQTIDTAMQSLIQKGLIRKVKLCKDDREMVAYSYRPNFEQGTQNLSRGYAKIAQGGCSKIEYMNNKDIKNKLENNTPFIPPTIKEVASFCKEKGYDVDPEAFVAFYDSKGWMVGKNKMRKWQSALVTWAKRSEKDARRAGTPKTQATGKRANDPLDYDFTKFYN